MNRKTRSQRSTERYAQPSGLIEPVQFISRECWGKLSQLKTRLTRELGPQLAPTLPPSSVAHAVNEAYALAALTAHPHLILPVLAEEKVHAAILWQERQRRIRDGQSLAFAS
jgi:hypothetical protein